MTVTQFLVRAERYWKKEYEEEQRKEYAWKLTRYGFHDGQWDAIWERLLESCRYLPRVSEIHSAAVDLNYTTQRTKSVPSTGCGKCEGIGWVYVTSHRGDNGEPYESVKRCSCWGGGRMPKRPDPPIGPGGWIVDGPVLSGTPLPKEEEEVPF